MHAEAALFQLGVDQSREHGTTVRRRVSFKRKLVGLGQGGRMVDRHEEHIEEAERSASHFALLGVGPAPETMDILHQLRHAFHAEDIELKNSELPQHPTINDPLDLCFEGVWMSIITTDVGDWLERVCALDPSLTSSEAKQAIASDWTLHIEAHLDGPDPFDDLRKQLRLLEALTNEVVRQIVDANALKVWHPEMLREFLATPRRPALYDLYSLHVVGATDVPAHAGFRQTAGEEMAPGRYWAHTHGLFRFGMPDIEIFDVPCEHEKELRELVDSIIGRILEEPDAFDRPFPLSQNQAGMFLPLEQMMEVLPEDVVGSDPHYRYEDETLHGVRLALVGLYTDEETDEASIHWDITPALRGIKNEGPVYRLANPTQRMAELAHHRLPLLRELWGQYRRPDWKVLVRIPQKGKGKSTLVNTWYEIRDLERTEVDGFKVNVRFRNQVKTNKKAERISLTDISGFVLITAKEQWDQRDLSELGRQLYQTS